MKKYITKEILKTSSLVLLAIGKAIWRSTLSVLYLIVYSFLLFALLKYYELSSFTIEPFLNLLKILVDNWRIFWWIFFASNIWDDWRFRK
jgi:hypothetical protein